MASDFEYLPCSNCGEVALSATDGGNPIKIERHQYQPQFEYGNVARLAKFPKFSGTYCSLTCAIAALGEERIGGD